MAVQPVDYELGAGARFVAGAGSTPGAGLHAGVVSSMADGLTVRVVRNDAMTLIEIIGDLDMSNVERLQAVFDELHVGDKSVVVVSFELCTYCDSTGLGRLVRLSNRIAPQLRVVVPKMSSIRRVFDITGLSIHLGVFDSFDDASVGIPVRAIWRKAL